jgi:hypothetical protein
MVVALALALAVAATVEAGYRVVRLMDVIVLAREGVSDRTVISFLENRELAFVVGTDEILRLRDAGAGEELIGYLIERTAPRDSYAPRPYADGSPYYDDVRSPYDEPGYDGAYIEYGPSYGPPYYVSATVGPYFGYDRYYRGGLGGWLGRTFGFGHRSHRYYTSRYDRGRSYDRGRGYDRGRSHDYARSYDRGRSYDRRSRYSDAGRANRGYRISSGRSSSHAYRSASRPTREHAVPRGRGRR